jgi:phospholipase C
MPATDRSHALDHVVVVLFENRSMDSVLGHLYGPEDGNDFDGVIGKDLSNRIPAWAEHGAAAPWNAPPAGTTPTMDGFVTDYISTFTGEIGRHGWSSPAY